VSQDLVSRRTIAKGAAWAVPAVTVMGAAPALAATPTDPGCGCLQSGSIGAFTAQAVTVLGLSNVTGSIVFNLDSIACNVGFFQPAYTIVGLGGEVTFSDGQVVPYTVGATTGVGTIGQVSAFTSTFTLFGVTMPNDAFPPYTKVPTQVCFQFTAIFVPIIPIPNIECSYELCYPITSPSSLGTVVLGTGTVNWTDLTPGAGTLTPL
jgi:hypothetical protein